MGTDEGSEATVELGQEVSDGEDTEPDEKNTPELDIVFDALTELAGEDGRCWVPVRQIQALRMTRVASVAFSASVADALEDARQI